MKRIIAFVKEWTLPVAIAAGMLVYALFSAAGCLATTGNMLAPYVQKSLPILMFFVLYVTFCKADFRKLLPTWWHLWVLLSQIVFVGGITSFILFLPLGQIERLMLESILVSAICPCATAAAVVTQKLGGNLEEMTSYTFISNFICAFIIPATLPLIEPNATISFATSFLSILYKVGIVLVLPMFLAYLTKHIHYFSPLLRRILRTKNLSFYLWCIVLMIVSGTTLRNILHARATIEVVSLIAVLALILCMLQFGIGKWIGHGGNRTIEAGQALGQKNTAFAIWIAGIYLNPLSTVGPGCYILWQNIVNSLQIWQYDRRHKAVSA